MSYSNKTFVLIVLLLFNATLVIGQVALPTQPQTCIKNFLHDLYQTNQEPLALAKRYVVLGAGPNEFSKNRRYQGIAEHLLSLRQGQAVGQSTISPNKQVLFNPDIHQVLPYSELNTASRLPMNLTAEQTKNVYVLMEADKPLRYFLMQGNKIIAFDYLVKGSGGPAFFISY